MFNYTFIYYTYTFSINYFNLTECICSKRSVFTGKYTIYKVTKLTKICSILIGNFFLDMNKCSSFARIFYISTIHMGFVVIGILFE